MDMYFDRETATRFAEAEENDKHRRVAKILDRLSLHELKGVPNPLHIVELGGGAHPDRYDGIFDRLMTEPRGQIDWVDVAPFMLELGGAYLDRKGLSSRKEVIRFIQQDLLEYLQAAPNASLDSMLLKYVAAFLSAADFERLTALASKKLKRGGCLIATQGFLKPEVPSHSTNARYSLNGELVPEGTTKELHHGDKIGINFFNISGDPTSGFLKGAESFQTYHSPEWIREVAQTNGLDCFIGDWSECLPTEERGDETLVQPVLVYRRT